MDFNYFYNFYKTNYKKLNLKLSSHFQIYFKFLLKFLLEEKKYNLENIEIYLQKNLFILIKNEIKNLNKNLLEQEFEYDNSIFGKNKLLNFKLYVLNDIILNIETYLNSKKKISLYLNTEEFWYHKSKL